MQYAVNSIEVSAPVASK